MTVSKERGATCEEGREERKEGGERTRRDVGQHRRTDVVTLSPPSFTTRQDAQLVVLLSNPNVLEDLVELGFGDLRSLPGLVVERGPNLRGRSATYQPFSKRRERTMIDSAAAFIRFSNSGSTLLCTSTRDPAEQLCPAFSKTPRAAQLTACSMSALANTARGESKLRPGGDARERATEGTYRCSRSSRPARASPSSSLTEQLRS